MVCMSRHCTCAPPELLNPNPTYVLPHKARPPRCCCSRFVISLGARYASAEADPSRASRIKTRIKATIFAPSRGKGNREIIPFCILDSSIATRIGPDSRRSRPDPELFYSGFDSRRAVKGQPDMLRNTRDFELD